MDEAQLDAQAMDDLARAADLTDQADALLIAAGAGFGVDSGLPDFRGTQGFWRAYPALAQARLDFASVASPATFERDPALAWGFYGHRLALYRRTVPHAGFAMLRAWGAAMPHAPFVFTSNVDGQFQRAGYEEEQVAEHHGAIDWLQCLAPCREAIWPADALEPVIDEAACRWRGALPTCPHCGGLARPNILMFGDACWVDARAQRQQARFEAWLRRVQRLLVIELGAGTHVPSVRRLSQTLVQQHGARLVRINPREPTVASRLDVGLPMGALEALRAIEALRAG